MSNLIRFAGVAILGMMATMLCQNQVQQSPYKCLGLNSVTRVFEMLAVLSLCKTLGGSKVVKGADGKRSYVTTGGTKKSGKVGPSSPSRDKRSAASSSAAGSEMQAAAEVAK